VSFLKLRGDSYLAKHCTACCRRFPGELKRILQESTPRIWETQPDACLEIGYNRLAARQHEFHPEVTAKARVKSVCMANTQLPRK
jgi:hypothetical protein